MTEWGNRFKIISIDKERKTMEVTFASKYEDVPNQTWNMDIPHDKNGFFNKIRIIAKIAEQFPFQEFELVHFKKAMDLPEDIDDLIDTEFEVKNEP